MNILYLCDEYPPCTHGGIGTVTQTLAREMVRKGHRVFVCGFYPYHRTGLPFEEDQGVQVFRRFYGNRLTLQCSRRRLLGSVVNIEGQFNAYTRWLAAFVKERQIDVIEMPDFNEAFRYSGPKYIQFPAFDVPVVLKLHGNYTLFDRLAGKLEDKGRIREKESALIHRATRIVAISRFTKAKVAEMFDAPTDMEVIYNGVSIDEEVIYNGELENTVVFAGTLSQRKGVFALLNSWKRVLTHVPTAKLLLYGKGGRDAIRQINRIVDSGLRRSVELRGFVDKDKLPSIYSSCGCAIFPSFAESFSMAPMESMKVGCPTIFTKRASGPELIRHGEDGLLVDPQDIDGMSEAIVLMLKDRKSAERMGRNGSTTIRERFDISLIADLHVNLYESLLCCPRQFRTALNGQANSL